LVIHDKVRDRNFHGHTRAVFPEHLYLDLERARIATLNALSPLSEHGFRARCIEIGSRAAYHFLDTPACQSFHGSSTEGNPSLGIHNIHHIVHVFAHQPITPLALLQRLFCPFTSGDVANGADHQNSLYGLQRTEANLDGKLTAILAYPP
jgi:hypothetical protein